MSKTEVTTENQVDHIWESGWKEAMRVRCNAEGHSDDECGHCSWCGGKIGCGGTGEVMIEGGPTRDGDVIQNHVPCSECRK
jgi:hypothetical protein